MDAHYNPAIDREAAARQAAWKAEWDKQFALLPEHKRQAITEDPMVAYADELDELVERALSERGEGEMQAG